MKIIIEGAGQVGSHLAKMLSIEGSDITVLDDDPERIRALATSADVTTVLGPNSSIGLLRDIHADVLKIDMSLLRGIESEQRNRAIVASIINMAGSLGMDVITEGVETGTQLKSLIDMGCHRFQGYYFSCPITVEQFEASTHAS